VWQVPSSNLQHSTTMTYRLLSTPFCYTPGVLRWVIESVAPFDRAKALEFLAALGLPEDAAATVANGGADITLEGETAIININAPQP